ncbi:class I SAM-dependent methyltransferase [Umezawaea sp. Da 62-37]|uniref:class I SAM-dependent methyltransferase n=1 Tax=Umezawaea sp. Da 62-37 TaxID=3075927 RepID=UPI0028F6D86E|nr:class I SAM-dependent methyltransferase [Umezawaea sp. Da 62-37]WNV91674.1 class I SAM-dependent methyltransferase [Umezawaea sp. Da 62-37]
MTDQRARVELRKRIYGTGDLSELPIFGGGFINFGYWRGVRLDGDLTLPQRIASQQALYDLLLDLLDVAGARVVEVGCGRGHGAASALRRGPELVRGVDLMPEQVARAAAAHHDERLAFVEGSASALPFDDGAFDRLLSVEAAQHFEDVAGFAREAHRVLVPGGRLAVTSFFANRPGAGPQIARLLATFENGLDLAHPIGAVLADLRTAGFVDVAAENIGEHVWPGLDRWIEQGGARNDWDRNWIKVVSRGLADYYLVTARRPVEAGSGA